VTGMRRKLRWIVVGTIIGVAALIFLVAVVDHIAATFNGNTLENPVWSSIFRFLGSLR
jgi:hypothetical protein